jgi:hypothetical protein
MLRVSITLVAKCIMLLIDTLCFMLGYYYEKKPNVAIRAKGRLSDMILKLDSFMDIVEELCD